MEGSALTRALVLIGSSCALGAFCPALARDPPAKTAEAEARFFEEDSLLGFWISREGRQACVASEANAGVFSTLSLLAADFSSKDFSSSRLRHQQLEDALKERMHRSTGALATLFVAAYALLEANELEVASQAIAELAVGDTAGSWSGPVLYLLCRKAGLSSEWGLVRVYAQSYLSQYPGGVHVPFAELNLALSYDALQEYTKAARAYGEYLERYPHSRFRCRVRTNLAWVLCRTGDLAKMNALYQELINASDCTADLRELARQRLERYRIAPCDQ
jgi:hypothetical protein